MSIQFCCPACSQPIEVDDPFGGKAAQCPYCARVITVPLQSSLEEGAPVSARPAELRSAPPPLPGFAPPPPMPSQHASGGAGPGNMSPREAASKNLGTYALIFAILAILLMIVGGVTGVAALWREMGKRGITNPTPEQMMNIMRDVAPQSGTSAGLQLGGMFFLLVAIALAAVSLYQHRESNWRSWLALAICVIPFGCICLSFAVSLAVGV